MDSTASPTRILQVINSSAAGGGAHHLQSLVAHLDRSTFRPVVATTDHGPMARGLEAERVRVVDVDMMRARMDPRPVLKLRRLISSEPFDLLHLHGTRAGFYGVLALSGLTRRPRVVYTVHGLSCSRAAGRSVRRFYAGVERFIATRADWVISVSERDRTFGVEERILPSDRTSSIPNGIAVEDGPRSTRTPFSQPDCVEVMTVGRLVPQKGIETLLEAAAQVVACHPQVRFRVLGDGPLRAALEGQARALGLGDRLRFEGHVSAVQDALESCDLFVLPSRWEGMPYSLLEAMAAGRPVVATAVSGAAEVVLDGETGLLVPPDDAGTLAGSIEALVGDPGRAALMGRQGRDRVRREFSLDRMLRSTFAVYQGLLS